MDPFPRPGLPMTDSPSPPTEKRADGSTIAANVTTDSPLVIEVNELPDRIGKYRVVECLGRGGQGAVFRAVHPVLGRDVVIKWASFGVQPEIQQRLAEEGRILAQLEDPGLVRVYDVDSHAGRPFVVFEYIAGQSLADILRRQRLSSRAAARIVAEVARVIDYAHHHGVVHRDLKPANVLIDANGRPRLLDFGLALLARPWSGAAVCESGVSGTLSYMAPEQANGQAELIGPRTDVFGLGALLYAMLARRPPHMGETSQAVWESARQGNVIPPRRHNPRIPRSLDKLCRQALAADPDQRLASAAQFRRALLAYLRRPWIVAAGIVAVALAIGIVVAKRFTGQTRPQEFVAEGAPEVRSAEVLKAQAAPAPEKPPEPPPGWKVYQSEKGGYSVWLPGTPTESQTGVATKSGERKMSQAKFNDIASGLTFLVSNADFGDKVFPDAEQALDAARDGAMTQSRAKLLSESRISLGIHPGREIRLGIPGVKGIVMRIQMFLVGQRHYQVIVGGPEKAVEGPSADVFFQSFRLNRAF